MELAQDRIQWRGVNFLFQRTLYYIIMSLLLPSKYTCEEICSRKSQLIDDSSQISA
jgi:hypothetical protein